MTDPKQRKAPNRQKFYSTSTQGRFKNTAERKLRSSEAGMSTNENETDFYFDFDQEGDV